MSDKAFFKPGKGLYGQSNTEVVKEDIVLFKQVKSTAELLNNGEGGSPFITIEALLNSTGTGIISGGLIDWLYGYTYRVPIYVYGILGTVYESEVTDVTLGPASSTVDENRIDVIVGTFDSEGNGLIEVVQGSYATVPAKPAINHETQIELTFLYVAAQTTEPIDVTNTIIYNENVEYVVSFTLGIVSLDPVNVTDPDDGTGHIKVIDFQSGDEIKFTGAFFTPSEYATLQFFIKPDSGLWNNNGNFKVGLYSGNTLVSDTLLVGSTGVLQNSFNSATPLYQLVSLALEDFVLTGADADNIRFIKDDGKGPDSFSLDLIRLQKGVISPPTAKINKTSDIATNDGADGTSTYAEHDELGPVATSNDYADLDNKPANLYLGVYVSLAALNIAHPTALPGNSANVDTGVGDDVQRYLWDDNGSEWVLGQGDHNTTTSELVNDGSDGTSTYVENDELATVATTGDYSDLVGAPNYLGGVETVYANNVAMIAGQGTQTNNAIVFSADASDDGLVESGYAYYHYLGTIVGNITDYRLLNKQELLSFSGGNKLHDQSGSTSELWVFNHNFNYLRPTIQVWDMAGNMIIPEEIIASDNWISHIKFPAGNGQDGYATAMVGGVAIINPDTIGYNELANDLNGRETIVGGVIDWLTAPTKVLTMAGTTTLTDSNLPQGTDTRVIELHITGSFSVTFPVAWNWKGGIYDGGASNLIVVTCVNGNSGSEEIHYQIIPDAIL